MRKKAREPVEFDLLNIFVMEMERQGASRNLIRLDVDDAIAKQIGASLGKEVPLERIQRLADKCLAHEWLEHTSIGNGQYGFLSLTTTGVGVVRSRQRKDDLFANRSHLKRASDYIEDHKGLFVALSFLIALAGVLITFFYRVNK
jgi:hypothetical protein